MLLVLRCHLVKNLAMKVKNLERYGKSKALLKDFVDLSKNYFDDADKNKVLRMMLPHIMQKRSDY